MAEQWISASRALEIAGDRFALCTRLHEGMIAARTKLFVLGDRRGDNIFVPKEFWWAGGHGALVQDWASGDFSTRMKGQGLAQAIGVEIGVTGLLEMVDFEQRAIMARGLSVAGSDKWLPALEARRLVYTNFGRNPMQAAPAIIELAKLGFIAGRAVLAEGVNDRRNHLDWDFQEREWDIPNWFWSGFTFDGTSAQNWETGRFSGNGLSPTGLTSMTLSGVHFQTASLSALAPKGLEPESAEPSNRGAKRKYDWDAAVAAIWGQIFRAELLPKHQSDVERAFQLFFAKRDKEPSESTIRPVAKRVWDEHENQADNSG